MKEVFSKRKRNTTKSIRTNNPFILRSSSKVVVLFFSLLILFFVLPQYNLDLIVYLPTFYIIGNLILETILYRVKGLKESGFQDKVLVEETFKVSLEQLDQASLKTNTIKWISLISFLSLGAITFFWFNWNADIFWISINTYGFVGIFIYGLCQKFMKGMPMIPFKKQIIVKSSNEDSIGMGITYPWTPAGAYYFYNYILHKP